MYSPITLAGNRLFVYEVAGLNQNDNTDSLDYSIRQRQHQTLQWDCPRSNCF